MTGVLIVGAGLGGLRAAEALRGSGYAGPISVVGEEPDLPYNRPPLSKAALAGDVGFDRLELRRKPSVDDVTWTLGTPASACDLRTRTVTLADGRGLAFDGLVIATGIRPRRLQIAGPVAGRFTLRTVADARSIQERLRTGAELVVLGAGFLGCEIASTARRLGAHVTVVALDSEPMVAALGADLGASLRRRHERHGVRFHLGRTAVSFDGADRVEGVILDDGTRVPASIVVEAVGSVPNVEWLVGNDLDLSDGVLVDAGMRVPTELAPVVAVGDIARHPNATLGPRPQRIEHFAMPTETGRRAGQTLAALLAGNEPPGAPFAAVPSFWSDQYDFGLQAFGQPGAGARAELVDGDIDGACIVEYQDAWGLAGVVGIDRTGDVTRYLPALSSRRVGG